MTGASRDQLRSEILSGFRGWYSPGLHLAVPSTLALLTASVALSRLHDVQAWQLAFLPLLLMAVNAAEWHAHRGVLHRHVKLLGVFYLRHTSVHHALFVPEDMVLRSPRELGLVLLPALALPVLLAAAAPITVALAVLGQENLGLFWLALVMVSFVAHEGLHVAYHLSPERWPGRTRVVTFLRRHHEHHHVPNLMAHWNFNATVPLWDLVRGTWWRPRAVPATHARRRG